ncbi:MAG: prepilin-type N-terminal cleavage/methylation domain-containing protein [Armatimonadetes bacterium]|nr:prepilin-type N-terminal cleavage/methylation domain-containing protein [Armatimonadota bacterium]
MRRRGLTLIELMITLAISGILVLAIAMAFSTGVKFQRLVPETEAKMRAEVRFEQRLRELLEGAYLTADITDQTAYFLTLSTEGELAVPDTLVFTSIGSQPTAGYIQSDDDFETLNEIYGPQGGLMEVSLSAIPVGDALVDTALFVRVQRPSDGDPTQGGMESALMEGIDYVRFMFFDGFEWVDEWDTLALSRRLPAAVSVIYTFEDDDEERSLTVRLPHSDVTPEDPVLLEVAG